MLGKQESILSGSRAFFILVLALATPVGINAQNNNPNIYQATWESLDSRPIPEWFTDAKFGIFIHWGVYSVPSYRKVSKKLYETYAEWYEASVMFDTVKGGRDFHVNNFGKDFEYRQFGPLFKAEMWDPDYWAEVFQRSGAKYVVLTSKHHDGYCLWPSTSPYSKNWNSAEVGPMRDIAGELTEAVRAKGMKMGFYYSLMEWESTSKKDEGNPAFNGYYLPKAVIDKYSIADDVYVDDHMLPQLKELITSYRPSIIFSDGEWDKPNEYWQSKDFLTWLYNEAPNKEELVVNDRWGQKTRGKHGGYYTSEYSSHQNDLSAAHPWEESRGMGESYGFNRAENFDDYRSSQELLYELISIVSRGGNLLLNIGPTADGRIPLLMQERLVDIGDWLAINGEAIYETRFYQALPKDSGVAYTQSKDGSLIYAIVQGELKATQELNNIKPVKGSEITLLENPTSLKWEQRGDDVLVHLPAEVRLNLKGQYAWSLRISKTPE